MEESDIELPIVKHMFKRSVLPSGALSEHISLYHDFVYVQEGTVTYIVDGVHHTLHSGWAAYIPQGCRKQAYMAPGGTMISYSCLFHLQDPMKKLSLPLLAGRPSPIILRQHFANLHQIWTDRQQGYRLKSSALALLIMSEM